MIVKLFSAMSAEKVDRRMKFPYTFTARLVQFPYKYYYNQKNAWVFRYGLYAAILTLPVFYKIEKLSKCNNFIMLAETVLSLVSIVISIFFLYFRFQ